jgi:hypothetical protein
VTLFILRKSDGKTYSSRMWHIVIGNASSQAAVGVHECHPRTSPSNTDLALVIDGPLSYLKFTTHKSFDLARGVASAALTRGLKSNAQLVPGLDFGDQRSTIWSPRSVYVQGQVNTNFHQICNNLEILVAFSPYRISLKSGPALASNLGQSAAVERATGMVGQIWDALYGGKLGRQLSSTFQITNKHHGFCWWYLPIILLGQFEHAIILCAKSGNVPRLKVSSFQGRHCGHTIVAMSLGSRTQAPTTPSPSFAFVRTHLPPI